MPSLLPRIAPQRRPARLRLGFVLLLPFLYLAGCEKPAPDKALHNGAPVTTAAAEGIATVPSPALLVEVARPRRGVIRDTIVLNGDLQARLAIDLTCQVSGVVARVHAREGDSVAEGAVLVELDDTELALTARQNEHAHKDAVERAAQAELELAEASHSEDLAQVAHARAEKDFTRFQHMRDAGGDAAFSDEEFDTRKYALEEARVAYERAVLARRRAEIAGRMVGIAVERARLAWERTTLDVDRCRIRTPLGGAVSYLELKPGEWVQTGTHVASVVDRHELYTEVRVPQRRLSSLAVGQLVEIRSEVSMEPRVYGGSIEAIHPTVEPREGTIKVRVGLTDADDALRPGVYVTATIITDTYPEALLIPKRARLFDGEESVVFVVRDGIARRIPVACGLQTTDELQVIESGVDLRADDLLIVRGHAALKDGMTVRVDGAAPGTPAAEAARDGDGARGEDPSQG